MFVATLPKLSGTVIVVPNLPKWYGCRIDLTEVVRYRGWCTELAEQSSTGITGGMSFRTYRTEHTLFCMLFKRYPLDYQLTKKVKIKKRTVSLNLNEYQSFAFIGLILMRVRFQASLYFGEVEKTKLDFVCANWKTCLFCEIGRGDVSRAICLLARLILQQFK